MESATVASLRDAVEARFCQALLPTSVAIGLEPSPRAAGKSLTTLTFTLITGPRFDPDTAARIARKFRQTL